LSERRMSRGGFSSGWVEEVWMFAERRVLIMMGGRVVSEC